VTRLVAPIKPKFPSDAEQNQRNPEIADTGIADRGGHGDHRERGRNSKRCNLLVSVRGRFGTYSIARGYICGPTTPHSATAGCEIVRESHQYPCAARVECCAAACPLAAAERLCQRHQSSRRNALKISLQSSIITHHSLASTDSRLPAIRFEFAVGTGSEGTRRRDCGGKADGRARTYQ
jgi:hypothetical protein